jgi:cytochrome c peroxidase
VSYPRESRRSQTVKALCLAAALGCSSPEEAKVAWSLPPGFPEPAARDNVSPAQAELGRHLFYDKRLSANQTQACASCHAQEHAFADARALPLGSTGNELPRNSPSLANSVYFASLTWANPTLLSLEKQAIVPLFNTEPVELGWSDANQEEILRRLRADTRYQRLLNEAYPGAQTFQLVHVTGALSAFQRRLISGRSRYDRYAYSKDEKALSAQEKEGLSLFFSERAECYHCHTGITFGGSFVSRETTASTQYENNGLYSLDAKGAYPAKNNGLFEFTQLDRDRGRFRVPSLRNVGVTAPYMHDGSIPTLEAVVAHYMAGGRNVESGPYAGDGRKNPNKNSLVREFSLTEAEKVALVAFLKSLTDEALLADPALRDPWQ